MPLCMCVTVCVLLVCVRVSFGLKVFDQSALSHEAKEEMYKLYPNARRAHLKTGGNFPYLCRSAEVNLYIQVSTSELVEKTHELPFKPPN